jgi:type IX secretion system PorP/SprF family membrane protein
MKKKNVYLAVMSVLLCSFVHAQQLPYYTQTNTNYYLLNPAVTGTKKLIDVRMNYRSQWAGFEGAPVTQAITLHSRIVKGLMGVGLSMYKDETGPLKHYNYGISYAFHARFPDAELSLGLSGNMMKYTLNGPEVTIHNSGDKAIDRTIIDSDWVPNMNGGLMLYNDRFHFGVSMLNMLEGTANFYEEDSIKAGKVPTKMHIFLSLGYNFSLSPDYVWEHTLTAGSIPGSPLLLDYNLRVHYRELFFLGTALRLKDAVALQTGVTIKKMVQIGYSYDLVVSRLHKTQSGSHEVTLAFRSNLFMENKRRGKLDEFAKQKYNLF